MFTDTQALIVLVFVWLYKTSDKIILNVQFKWKLVFIVT